MAIIETITASKIRLAKLLLSIDELQRELALTPETMVGAIATERMCSEMQFLNSIARSMDAETNGFLAKLRKKANGL